MTSYSRELQLRRYQRLKLAVFLGILGLTFTILVTIDNMLVSSLIAFVMAYLMGPLVDALERMGIQRLFGIILVFLLTTLTFAVAVQLMLPFITFQFSSLRQEVPKYIEGTTSLLQNIEVQIEGLTGAGSQINLSERVANLMTHWASAVFDNLPGIVSRSLTVILLAPFLAFFLLKDGRRISRSLLALVPNNMFEMFLNLYNQINDQMGQFVRARILEAAIVGLVVWLGLWIINFPYAPLLAAFAALTNLIPYIGPIIGAVPAIIIALINGASSLSLFVMGSIYLTAQIIDVFIIIPLVVAKIVNLHPVTVMVALLVGSQVMGVVGMVVSIPVASVLKVTFTSLYQHMIQFRA